MLIIGYILIGAIVGFLAAAVSVFAGATLWGALGIYACAGMSAVTLAVVIKMVSARTRAVRKKRVEALSPDNRGLVRSRS